MEKPVKKDDLNDDKKCQEGKEEEKDEKSGMIEKMSAERQEFLKRMKQARKEMEEESFGKSPKDKSTGEGLKERKYKKRKYKTNDVD